MPIKGIIEIICNFCENHAWISLKKGHILLCWDCMQNIDVIELANNTETEEE